MKLSTKGRYAVMALVDLASYSKGHPLALAEIAQQVLRHVAAQLEAQIGCTGLELGNRRRQDGAAEIARNAHAQRRHGRTGSNQVQYLIVDPQQATRIVDDQFAFFGQGDAGRAFVEQLGVEKKLQPLDMGADGRLGNPERLRRFGEAALLRYSLECYQVAQIVSVHL